MACSRYRMAAAMSVSDRWEPTVGGSTSVSPSSTVTPTGDSWLTPSSSICSAMSSSSTSSSALTDCAISVAVGHHRRWSIVHLPR